MLSHPKFDEDFVIETDASDVAIGAVLSQKDEEGRLKPIAYFSKALSGSQSNYSATEKEFVAIVHAVKHFRPYIYGRHVDIYTDHQPLSTFKTSKIGENRLARWCISMTELDYEIFYRKGSSNGNADALSRLPIDNPKKILFALTRSQSKVIPLVDTSAPRPRRKTKPSRKVRESLETDTIVATNFPNPRTSELVTEVEIKTMDDPILQEGLALQLLSTSQKCDPEFGDIYNFLVDNAMPHHQRDRKRLLKRAALYVVQNGVLFRLRSGLRARKGTMLRLLVVPLCFRDKIMSAYHNSASSGHLGVQHTLDKIRIKYFWPSMVDDVATWIKCCKSCQAVKTPVRAPAPLQRMPIPSIPFEIVGIDATGPFNVTSRGNRYIIVVCDYLTRYVETFAVPEQSTKEIIQPFIDKVILRHGAPKVLISDNGSPFVSEVAKAVYDVLQIDKRQTSTYHPQTNGLVERFNGTLKQMLKHYCDEDQTNWDVMLQAVTFAYNTSVHSALKETPFYLLHGRDPRLAVDTPLLEGCRVDELTNLSTTMDAYRRELVDRIRIAHSFAQDQIKTKQDDTLKNNDRSGMLRPNYQLGQKVLLYNPVTRPGLRPKLVARWEGPYRVIKIHSDVLFTIIDLDGEEKKVHANRIKRFYADDSEHPLFTNDSHL